MNEDEALAFVMAKPRTAKLATVRKDGRPHVVPIWVDYDDDRCQLVFNVGEESLKIKALRRDPRVALCFDDEEPPFTFVLVEGDVSLSNDADEVREWAARIGGRYMGADRAQEYGERNAVPTEFVARVTPTKIIGFDGVAD